MANLSHHELQRQATELKSKLVDIEGKLDSVFKLKVGSNLERLLTDSQFLISWLESTDPDQRGAALCALAHYWDSVWWKDFIPWVERLTQDNDHNVRLTAISVLSELQAGGRGGGPSSPGTIATG